MESSSALEIVAMVAAAYPAWRPSRQTMLLYARLLEELPAAETREAIMQIIRSEREFAPAVGTIHVAVTKLIMAANGQPLLEPGEAWAIVQEAIQYSGYYREPRFSNVAINKAVKALGWKDICANENIEATRAQFFKVFAQIQNRQLSDAANRIGDNIRPMIGALANQLIAGRSGGPEG